MGVCPLPVSRLARPSALTQQVQPCLAAQQAVPAAAQQGALCGSLMCWAIALALCKHLTGILSWQGLLRVDVRHWAMHAKSFMVILPAVSKPFIQGWIYHSICNPLLDKSR